MIDARTSSVAIVSKKGHRAYVVASTDKQALRAVLVLAEHFRYDRAHTHRVAHLALQLFEEMQPVHRLGYRARFCLTCAAILHDIAKNSGAAHHKAVLGLVLTTPELPFNLATRRMIGLIARYHRKAVPTMKHEHFSALTHEQRDVVRQLAAILRLSDALDAGHRGIVRTVRCKISSGRIVGRCTLARQSNSEDRWQVKKKALKKGMLLEDVFGCKLAIKWSADEELSKVAQLRE